jgi:hypothetical protein
MSEDSDRRAAYQATQIVRRNGQPDHTVLDGGDCPECSAPRRTAETLRVHRWIAHGVRTAA